MMKRSSRIENQSSKMPMIFMYTLIKACSLMIQFIFAYTIIIIIIITTKARLGKLVKSYL